MSVFDELDPGTWSALPSGYEWRTVDYVTGESHLFAPDGRNASSPGTVLTPVPPESAVNAVIVRAMLDHPYRAGRAGSRWFAWCDMTPVVTATAPGPTDTEYGADDVWWVEVQYSTRGARASYGVDRDNVPTLYAD